MRRLRDVPRMAGFVFLPATNQKRKEAFVAEDRAARQRANASAARTERKAAACSGRRFFVGCDPAPARRLRESNTMLPWQARRARADLLTQADRLLQKSRVAVSRSLGYGEP